MALVETLLSQSDPANAVLLVFIYVRLKTRLDRVETRVAEHHGA